MQKWRNILINFVVNLLNNNKFINVIVVIDYFTKIQYIIPMDLINTILVTKYFIKYVFKLYKLFNLIISNRRNWVFFFKRLYIIINYLLP